jgi:hypothetical protein
VKSRRKNCRHRQPLGASVEIVLPSPRNEAVVRHPVVRHPVVRHPVDRHPVDRHPVDRHPVDRPELR